MSEHNQNQQATDAPLLKVRGLSVHFKQGSSWFRARPPLRAVEDVDLELAAGETLSIVGESGSGKSTLARGILQLLKPTKGQVWLNGKELGTLAPEELRLSRKDMQLIFQDPIASLSPRRTVEQIISEPLLTHMPQLSGKERREKVAAIMASVGLLPDMRNRYPHEFSGGQAQRIGIARALVMEPQLLVADEPVSALDVSIQAQVLNLLADIKEQRQVSMLFISHDLSVVHHISDRLLVLYLGQVMEIGDASAIYERPQHPYTKVLLSAVPRMQVSGREQRKRIYLKDDLPSPSAKMAGCPFATRCPVATSQCHTSKPKLTDFEGRQVACHFPGIALEGEQAAAA